jgi:hypothetical protein
MAFYLDPTYYMTLRESMIQNANNYPAIQPLPMRKRAPSLYFYDQNQDQPRKIDPVASGLMSETGEIMPVEGYSFVNYNVLKQYMSPKSSENEEDQNPSIGYGHTIFSLSESTIIPEHARGSLLTNTVAITASPPIFQLDDQLSSYPCSPTTKIATPTVSISSNPSSSQVYSAPKPSVRESEGRRKKQSVYNKEYGTKQSLIDKSHNDLVKHYTKLGLYHGDGLLRGEDTIRIHVKTVPTLENIEHLLEEIRTMVGITQIDIPISMKNSHQKKGYTVFVKFASAKDIPKAQAIVENHSHIFQCAIALTRSD